MLKIYNTLTRKKENFIPIDKKEVKIYVCGPTIYDYGHLGHARSAVVFDIFRKYLIYKKNKVKFVFNYTDIDDKIINKENKKKISYKEINKKFERIYDEDYKKLGILKPTIKPKPTNEIKAIIEFIKKIEKNGYTYKLADGIYFDISKFKDYGILSKQKIEELKAGARVKKDDKKKNPEDFVLWKFKKPREPFWKSPWGDGRPGWHIECSAMSTKYLGNKFDVHGGGQDLIFPHHEDELAQNRAAMKKQVIKYWMHNGFVKIDNEKMSKSLGNFIILTDFLKKNDPKVVRFALLSTHYRMPINFTDKIMEKTKNSLERINNFIIKLKNNNGKDLIKISNYKKKFENAMDDDLNISKALSVIYDLIKEGNNKNLSKKSAKETLNFLKETDSILNIMNFKEVKVSKDILCLIKKREYYRKKKEFKKADEIRDKLKKKGIILEDTKEGIVWKFK